MTFQQAQAEFTAIVDALAPALPAPELSALQQRLRQLQAALPLADEFDPLNDAIIAIAPQLHQAILAGELQAIRARSAALRSATALLDRTATQATKEARTLRFDQPKLVFAGLAGGINTIRELRVALGDGDLASAQEKTDALLVLLAQLRATVQAA